MGFIDLHKILKTNSTKFVIIISYRTLG